MNKLDPAGTYGKNRILILFLANYYLYFYSRIDCPYGLVAFQNYPQHALFLLQTCSDKEEIGLDFISHTEGKDAGDAFNHLIQCCWLLKMLLLL